MTHDLLMALGRGALAAGLTLVLVLAVRVPARRWLGAAFAYRLWLLVPVAALATLLPAPVRPLIPALQVAPSAPSSSATIELRAAVAQAASFDWQPWLLALWIAGALALVVVFARQQRRYLKNLGALSAGDHGALRAQATDGCPALVGALRPRIVVPSDFELRYTKEERELVLAHERTHLVRGDAQINALAALLRCLNWFNPLFHLAASRFRFDQEIACDAAVISRFPEARRCYADAMLKAQRVGESWQELRLPAGCLWPASHPLKERIAMLKFPAMTGVRRTLASTAIVALVSSAGYASWAALPGRAPADEAAPKVAGAAESKQVIAAPSLKIDLPQPDRNQLPPLENRPAPVTLSVRSNGQFYWNGRLVSEEEVRQAMEVLAKQSPQPVLLIQADSSAKYELVASVMTDAKGAGMEKIGFEAPRGSRQHGAFVPATTPAIAKQFAFNGEKPTASDKPATSIQPGEIPDMAPSVNITYRKMQPPKYPLEAVKAGVGAKVILKVLIDEQGNAKSAEIEKLQLIGEPKSAADGTVPDRVALEESFAQASKAAMLSWKFNPGLKDGKPFEGYALVPIDFSTHGCTKEDPCPQRNKPTQAPAAAKKGGRA